MQPIVINRGLSLALSVCRSVTLVSPAKMAEPIEILFELWARMGPRNHVLDGVQSTRSPMGRVTFGKMGTIVKYRDFLLWAVQKRLNHLICHSGGPKEAQVESYSPGGTNVFSWGGILAPPGEYDWTVHVRQHAMLLYVKLLWPLVSCRWRS